MTGKIKTAGSVPSVGADVEQPLIKNHNEIIANQNEHINLQATEKLSKGQRFGAAAIKNLQKSNQETLNAISMTELYDTVYTPRVPVIDGLLYGGTYLFAGSPKIGKSFFMAQLAYHVAAGHPLWEYPVRQGTVLYLALEDDYARLQRRLSVMFGIESTDRLYFAISAKPLNEGLDAQLESFIKEHADARLVIIDTLQKVRDVGGDRYSYSNDYDIVAKLKAFSDRHGICILAVHHTRKLESGDSFDMISGTNGLLGAADGAFIMQKKKRTDNLAVLDISGRDQPDQELTVEFDRKRCVWNFKKAETELWKQPPDPVLEAVAGLLLNDGQTEWSGTASELVQLLQMDMQPNVLTRKLNISADRLYAEYGIHYESNRGHSGRLIILRLLTEQLEERGEQDDETGIMQADI